MYRKFRYVENIKEKDDEWVSRIILIIYMVGKALLNMKVFYDRRLIQIFM